MLTLHFSAKRPPNPAYPTELITIGDHLRKARMDRGLYQAAVARILNSTEDSIKNWENNHNIPKVSKMKGVIEFLGYVPYSWENGTRGMRLYVARQSSGLSYKNLGRIIKVDPATISGIERKENVVIGRVRDQCEKFILSQLGDSILT